MVVRAHWQGCDAIVCFPRVQLRDCSMRRHDKLIQFLCIVDAAQSVAQHNLAVLAAGVEVLALSCAHPLQSGMTCYLPRASPPPKPKSELGQHFWQHTSAFTTAPAQAGCPPAESSSPSSTS